MPYPVSTDLLEQIPESLLEIFSKRQKNIEVAFSNLADGWSALMSGFEKYNQSTVSLEIQFCRALLLSSFVHEHSCNFPDDLLDLFSSSALWQNRNATFYDAQLRSLCSDCASVEQWMSVLRKFRQKEMLRYIWREANALGSLQNNMKEYSYFARAGIDVSLDFLYEEQKKTFGSPLSEIDQSEQKMAVLAMGKLGGEELNLSSDIDLIFFYRDKGVTNGARSIENQQFFVRLAQQLIRVLDDRTADGFVFRVDMRLRPYGESGLLVLNQNAMELYYETQGRAWERYAFLKADVAAGDKDLGKEFLEVIRPFVYRKYVDFSVLESLREMKLLINRQVKSKGMENDIKLGQGGIRELEFIAQAFQLIKGGRKTQLQTKSYYQAMQLVVELELMTSEDSELLVSHYNFFRKLEHLIQAQADQQTQMLPDSTAGKDVLAWIMDFSSYADLFDVIQQKRADVRNHFNDLFAPPESEKASSDEQKIKQKRYELALNFWLNIEDEQQDSAALGFSLSPDLIQSLTSFSQEKTLKSLGEVEKKRLDSCVAHLVLMIADFNQAEELFQRSLSFIRVILKRSAYLVLLIENPDVFKYVLSLFSRSKWILDKLIQHPFLLDELLRLQHKKTLPTADELFDQLRQLSLRMNTHDLEMRLEELRVFKCTYEFEAAVLYLDKHVSTTQLGDFLSYLAEAILQEACRFACEEINKKELGNTSSYQQFIDTHFAIIAYGKLGSQEMGFGSDLDLVFLYDAEQSCLEEPARFLTKLGQKIIHLLSLRTYSGILYEVDMRLRPSGKAGQLVSSLHAFEKYQQENAWTWEHQALVKARVVWGSKQMQQQFEQVRTNMLTRHREQSVLLTDMNEMRGRLREKGKAQHSQSVSGHGEFHLKSDEGGIVDIEFIAQYIVLMHASQFPSLAKARATLEVFELAEKASGLRMEYLAGLREVYLLYRRHINELTLAYDKVLVDAANYVPERAVVAAAWQKLMDTESN